MEQIIGLIVTLAVMLIAVAGSVLPGIPSTPLILLAAVGHKLYFGASSVSWVILGLLGAITALSLILDYLAGVYGAKKFGATKWGMFGAMAGGIVGIFFSYPGLILGPFLGALCFEMLAGQKWKAGSKAGLGATIGVVLGVMAKVVCCFAMIGIFVMDIFWHSKA